MRSIEDIENERVAKQKELNVANESHSLVEDKKLQLQRQIITLQGEKKDLEIILNKSNTNIKMLKNNISILTNDFWKSKNS